MDTGHPSWCIRTEAGDADHVSETLHAAESDELIDISLRLTHPQGVAADDTQWTLLEFELVDCGEVFGFPLELRQAQALAESLVRLMSPPSKPTVSSLPVPKASPTTHRPHRARSDLGA